MNGEIDLQRFRVINSQLARFSASEIRITSNALSFNMTTAAELKYAPRVCLLADDDCNLIALAGCANGQLEDLSVPFFNKMDLNNFKCTKRIPIKDKNFVQALRAAKGWDSDKKGRKAMGVYYAKQNLLLFDLSEAVLTSDKSKNYKRKPSITNYPTLYDLQNQLKPQPLQLPAQCI